MVAVELDPELLVVGLDVADPVRVAPNEVGFVEFPEALIAAPAINDEASQNWRIVQWNEL